ncbi:hypothetical protein OAJ42_00530 [Flavobacteriales bacterium]|nr:hypothetical protein [Flavobacteriales bacterium]MDC0189351.1 hypothetical protein [Flavobacteriales bacterium]
MKNLLLLLIIPFLSFGQSNCDYAEIGVFINGTDPDIAWSFSQEDGSEIILGNILDSETICIEDGCWIFNVYSNSGTPINSWNQTQYLIYYSNEEGDISYWNMIAESVLTNPLSNSVYVTIGDPIQCGCHEGEGGFSWNYNDIDNDGICTSTPFSDPPNSLDNCPFVYNPLQEDSDNNGVGDLCEEEMYGCMDELACNYVETAISECGNWYWQGYVAYDEWIFLSCCNYTGEVCVPVPDEPTWFFNENCECVETNTNNNCNCTNTTVICDYGSNQEEVSWFIIDSSGSGVASGGAPYSGEVCLENDCYILQLIDSGGDGWNNNSLVIGNQVFTLNTGSFSYDEWCSEDQEDEGFLCGCTDTIACNYSADATDDDGSCDYPEQYYNCNGDCLIDTDTDGVCDELDNCPYDYNPNQEIVCDITSIYELSNTKNLITTLDVLGRENPNKGFQLHIYDDGTVEKKYLIK